MNNRHFLRCALFALMLFTVHCSLFTVVSCSPEPPLHLYDAKEVELEQPIIDLNLDVYWDYEIALGIDYDWQTEWYYGWDDEDKRIWGELGYAEPKTFNLRRYYTGNLPNAPHAGAIANTVEGRRFSERYDWGFWDILVWNQISTFDGVQSLVFDEQTSLDSVTAHTNPSMVPSRYNVPKYTRAFYAPEPLFSSYEEDIDVNRDLRGFTFDSERNVWSRTLTMMLRPITYIYLTQVILHNNKGRISSIDGSSNLSGMARTTTLNNGRAGDDAITVNYGVRMKRSLPLVPYKTRNEVADTVELVDIIGGRLMTFGIPGHKANSISRAEEVIDKHKHFMDLTMQFSNGIDSTFVFDVTDQVRRHYKGGVITVELNMDTIPTPSRRGGSGFNAVVLDPDTITHVIEM